MGILQKKRRTTGKKALAYRGKSGQNTGTAFPALRLGVVLYLLTLGVTARIVCFALLKVWGAIPRVESCIPRITFWMKTWERLGPLQGKKTQQLLKVGQKTSKILKKYDFRYRDCDLQDRLAQSNWRFLSGSGAYVRCDSNRTPTNR